MRKYINVTSFKLPKGGQNMTNSIDAGRKKEYP